METSISDIRLPSHARAYNTKEDPSFDEAGSYGPGISPQTKYLLYSVPQNRKGGCGGLAPPGDTPVTSRGPQHPCYRGPQRTDCDLVTQAVCPMLVRFFAATSCCGAIFLWRVPVEHVDKHGSGRPFRGKNSHEYSAKIRVVWPTDLPDEIDFWSPDRLPLETHEACENKK